MKWQTTRINNDVYREDTTNEHDRVFVSGEINSMVWRTHNIDLFAPNRYINKKTTKMITTQIVHIINCKS